MATLGVVTRVGDCGCGDCDVTTAAVIVADFLLLTYEFCQFPIIDRGSFGTDRHGGGAFLIPYTIMNLIAGIPLFLMEMSIGQVRYIHTCGT